MSTEPLVHPCPPAWRALSLALVVALVLLVTQGAAGAAASAPAAAPTRIDVGPRPHYLIDLLPEGPLKTRLQACQAQPVRRTLFSIAHRGAPLQFPEHTRESYLAAARMGAGIIECDVTFTRDRELVCRHAQCDLHATTNILQTPLAAKCSQPFTPAAPGRPASARCCTSDLTLAEFKTLKGKMDGVNPRATTVAEFVKGTPDWRTEAYAATGTLMTHRESIALFQQLGVGMTPELKAPEVPMPFEGDYTQAAYAQQMIDDYKAAGVPPQRVWPQSFSQADIRHWLRQEPAFARQAVALIGVTKPADLPAAQAALAGLRAEGVQIVAPPLWAMLTLDAQGRIVPSAYARTARRVGLKLIGWSLERSGTLSDGGGFFYQGLAPAITGPGDTLRVVDVLAQDVGVIGLFSDWPGTVSAYASCVGKP